MKTGVSEHGLQKFVDQTQKAMYLSGFSQIERPVKFVEFRRDFAG